MGFYAIRRPGYLKINGCPPRRSTAASGYCSVEPKLGPTASLTQPSLLSPTKTLSEKGTVRNHRLYQTETRQAAFQEVPLIVTAQQLRKS